MPQGGVTWEQSKTKELWEDDLCWQDDEVTLVLMGG